MIASYDQNISLIIFFCDNGSHVRLWHPSCVYFTTQRQYSALYKKWVHLWNNYLCIIILRLFLIIFKYSFSVKESGRSLLQRQQRTFSNSTTIASEFVLRKRFIWYRCESDMPILIKFMFSNRVSYLCSKKLCSVP